MVQMVNKRVNNVLQIYNILFLKRFIKLLIIIRKESCQMPSHFYIIFYKHFQKNNPN